jgi:proline iminopeptidase
MPRTAFEMRDAFPAGVAQVHVYEHSGHRPWVEEGDAFFRDLESFLDGKNGQTMTASPPSPTH